MKLYAANRLDYLDQKVNWVITTTCLLIQWLRTFKLAWINNTYGWGSQSTLVF